MKFIARLRSAEGRFHPATFRAKSFETARADAEKAFPDSTVITIYPEDESDRLKWVWRDDT